MQTNRMQELRQRMKTENKKWIARVINEELISVETHYYSDKHSLKQILHKVELDLMTNLSLNLSGRIIVEISEAR